MADDKYKHIDHISGGMFSKNMEKKEKGESKAREKKEHLARKMSKGGGKVSLSKEQKNNPGRVKYGQKACSYHGNMNCSRCS